MARWHQDCKNCDGEPLAWVYSEGCQETKMEIHHLIDQKGAIKEPRA